MILAQLRRFGPSQRGLSAAGPNPAGLLHLRLCRACFQGPFLTARSGEESSDNIWPAYFAAANQS